MFKVYSDENNVWVELEGKKGTGKCQGSFASFTDAKEHAQAIMFDKVSKARHKYELAKMNSGRLGRMTKKRLM